MYIVCLCYVLESVREGKYSRPAAAGLLPDWILQSSKVIVEKGDVAPQRKRSTKQKIEKPRPSQSGHNGKEGFRFGRRWMKGQYLSNMVQLCSKEERTSQTILARRDPIVFELKTAELTAEPLMCRGIDKEEKKLIKQNVSRG